jgi:FlaA1/EpsC-like NDP-sugar epimerase
MSNVLVTGATGFLGKYVVKELLEKNHKVVALGNSELRAAMFQTIFKETPLYLFDLSNDYGQIKKIIKEHNIEYIIHSAALKHVSLCESNVMRAIDVNIIGTKNIINAANECNIKNIIGISTDKSINPSCIYGTTKKLVEDMLKNQNYGIFQGVNFFYSSGSVLEIWEKQMKEGNKITVNNHANRYFTLAQDVAKTVVNNLDRKETFSIDKCYKINISDLQKAFSKFYSYFDIQEHNLLKVEKTQEEVPDNVQIIEANIEDILSLIKTHKLCEI